VEARGKPVGFVCISCPDLSGLVGRSAKFSVTEWREISAWLRESWAKQAELRPLVTREWERKVIDGISGRPSSSGRLTTSVGILPRAADGAEALVSSPVASTILTWRSALACRWSDVRSCRRRKFHIEYSTVVFCRFPYRRVNHAWRSVVVGPTARNCCVHELVPE